MTEQSAIRAGDGGFQVNVKGNTTLNGGAITSTQAAVDEHKNSFQTGGQLTLIDIKNQADYQGHETGITLGTGSAGGLPVLPGVGMGSESGHAASTTQAAISGIAGNQDARTGDAETGIRPIFNQQQVKDNLDASTTVTLAFQQQAGQTGAALTKGALSEAADLMTQESWRNSMLFAGIVDQKGQVLSNISGRRLGGTRVDLDKICGTGNENCKTIKNPDGTTSLDTNDKGQYIYIGNGTEAGGTWEYFKKTQNGQEACGKTGCIQGAWPKTFFGITYQPDSLLDRVVEAFGGPHDFIGGQITGLYDAQGDIRRGMSPAQRWVYDNMVTTTAPPLAAPFAASSGLPPGVWNAISATIK